MRGGVWRRAVIASASECVGQFLRALSWHLALHVVFHVLEQKLSTFNVPSAHRIVQCRALVQFPGQHVCQAEQSEAICVRADARTGACARARRGRGRGHESMHALHRRCS